MVDLELLGAINEARKQKSPSDDLEQQAERLYQPQHRFAVYGSLAPGCPNNHHIAHLGGQWIKDFKARGTLTQSGWGAAMGYPGIVLGEQGDDNPVQLLESDKLTAAEWSVLDTFEGQGYVRLLTALSDGNAIKVANIYALASV